MDQIRNLGTNIKIHEYKLKIIFSFLQYFFLEIEDSTESKKSIQKFKTGIIR
jgi:hypothetical protein